MSDILSLLFVLACAAAPIVAMPLLWRRMKRVRAGAYAAREPLPPATPWRERVQDRGLSLDRTHAPNDELIALGDKGRARALADRQSLTCQSLTRQFLTCPPLTNKERARCPT